MNISSRFPTWAGRCRRSRSEVQIINNPIQLILLDFYRRHLLQSVCVLILRREDQLSTQQQSGWGKSSGVRKLFLFKYNRETCVNSPCDACRADWFQCNLLFKQLHIHASVVWVSHMWKNKKERAHCKLLIALWNKFTLTSIVCVFFRKESMPVSGGCVSS